MTYFGFAVADSMFADGVIVRRELDIAEARNKIEDAVPCLNPSHVATILAMNSKFAIHVGIPSSPPKVVLTHGDKIIVMGVRGLSRLIDRHEYTEAEIESATFTFSEYTYLDLRLRAFVAQGYIHGGGSADVGAKTLIYDLALAEVESLGQGAFSDCLSGVMLE